MTREKPRIWPSLLLGALFVPFTYLVAAGVGGLFRALEALGFEPFGSRESSYLGFWFVADAVLVSVLFLLARRSREDPWGRFALRPSRLSWWLLPAVVAGHFAAGVLGSDLADLFFRGPGQSVPFVAQAVGSLFEDAWLPLLLTLAVLPAITEEMIFRGFIQSRLVERMPAALAIAISSVFFSVAHAEPQHSLAVLPVGVWLGYVAFVSGSLWLGIASHFIGNALFVLGHGLWAEPEATERGLPPQDAVSEPSLVAMFTCVLALLLLGKLLHSRRKRRGMTIPLAPVTRRLF